MNISYGGLSEKTGGKTPNIQSIAQAVIEIRSAKLPDPNKLETAVVFKNPVIPSKQFVVLQQQYPRIPTIRTKLVKSKFQAFG